MGYSEQGTWAGRWSIFLGACLGLIAAGSFVAFSVVARDAGASGLAGRVEARRLSGAPVVITVSAPPNNSRSGDRLVSARQGEANQLDSVLGTRFFASPPPGSSTPAGGGNPPDQPTPGPGTGPSARPGSPDSPGKHGKPPKSRGGSKDSPGHSGGSPGHSGGSPGHSGGSPAPEPEGKAKGHDKARGKGHDKHGD